MGEESLDRVDSAIQVHVDDTIDGVKLEIVDAHKWLDDAGNVDEAVYLTVSGDDGIRQR